MDIKEPRREDFGFVTFPGSIGGWLNDEDEQAYKIAMAKYMESRHFPHILWILTPNLDVIRLEVRFAVSSLWAVGTDNFGKPHLIDMGTNWYRDEEMCRKTERELRTKRKEHEEKKIAECDERLEKLTSLKQQQ